MLVTLRCWPRTYVYEYGNEAASELFIDSGLRVSRAGELEEREQASYAQLYVHVHVYLRAYRERTYARMYIFR